MTLIPVLESTPNQNAYKVFVFWFICLLVGWLVGWLVGLFVCLGLAREICYMAYIMERVIRKLLSKKK